MTTQRPTFVRWNIIFLKAFVAFMIYFTRNNMSVAGKYIQDDYGFSLQELGWIFTAFSVTYVIFQIPGGVFSQRVGSRRMVTFMLCSWGILTILTGFLPGLLYSGTTAVIAVLIIVRLLMGVVQAPYFPTSTGIIERWFPSTKIGIAMGVGQFMLYFGGAAVGPIIVFLVSEFGWRASFYLTSPLAFVLAAIWWWYTRDTPQEHEGVSEAELEIINTRQIVDVTDTKSMSWWDVLQQKQILFITMSYFCHGYVTYFFYNWLFIYLIKERGFGDLEGGFASAVPWLSGAVAAIAGGYLCDYMIKRYSPGRSLKLICVVSLFLIAGFMYSGAVIENKYMALLLLSICYSFVQVSEIGYWQATALMGGDQTTVACSVLNTGSNLMGVLAIPLLAYLLETQSSLMALGSCSFFAILAAFFWIFVDAGKQIGK
jgi:ACS family glucarate transporter-like MFS transporter